VHQVQSYSPRTPHPAAAKAMRRSRTRAPARARASDAELRQRSCVLVCERLSPQLGEEPLVIPHIQIFDLPQDIDLARHARRFTEPYGNEHAPLRVEFTQLSEVVDSIEKPHPRRMRAGHVLQSFLDREPSRHAINAHGLACYAGDVQVRTLLVLNQGSKRVRDLGPTLRVNLGGIGAAKHFCSTLLQLRPRRW